MDRNTLLAFALSMVVYFGWVLYTGGFQPPPEATDGQQVEELAEGQPPGTETGAGSAAGSTPEAVGSSSNTFAKQPSSPSPAPAAEPQVPQLPAVEREFAFDTYVAKVSTRGGTLVSVYLPEYRESKSGGGGSDQPIELIRSDEQLGGALQTPFLELGLGDLSQAVYAIESHDPRSITFVLRREGVVIRKEIEFQPERYAFVLSVSVENGAGHLLSPTFEVVWPAIASEGLHFQELSLVARQTTDGEEDVYRELVRSYGSPGFFSKLFGGEFEPVLLEGGVDWAGVDVKYFLTALAPAADRADDTEVRFDALGKGVAAVRLLETAGALAPGNTEMRRFEGFLGPKRDELLESADRGFEDSVNLGYSWISPLTLFFRWLLRVVYSVVHNYGVAIIVITVLVRVLTLPIMMRQMKSMEKMRALQPRMKELQEKYADDRQKQSEEMMKMYRETGVNPLASCFPMLLQFPVFIGLFYALQSSIDLWQAPFVFWIDDLSSPEQLFTIPGLGLPVRLLPVIMAASMVLQQKMTPTTVDPSQETMMLIIMPAMMLVLFYQFPSGLVLYWMVSNFLGIGHQLWIRRGMEEKPA